MHWSKPHLSGVLTLATALLVAACAGERPFAPHAVGGPHHNEADTHTGDLVLWPSDDVYQEPSAAGGAGASYSIQSASVQPTIRIGVVQTSDTVLLGGTGAWTIRDKANGVHVMSGTGGAARVTLDAVPEAYWYLQVTCAAPATVSEIKARAEALGYYTLTEAIPACTRLLLGRWPTSATWTERVGYKNTAIAQGLAGDDAWWRTITIGTQVVYRVTRGATSVQNLNPVVITSEPDAFITIGNRATTLRRYRGTGEARINSAAKLAGINELPVEEYLYGVLPQELGPLLYPEFEAQKAQAVTARTYAIAGRGKRASDGYDLRATTDDQVYGGYPVEQPVSNAAVDATAGIVATWDGRVISTNFFSTSGGHTANNEEAFVGTPVPYQRGVPDAERGEALTRVPSLEVFRAHGNPTRLRNAGENEFDSDDRARYHRWTFSWTASEISSVISAWAGQPVGAVHAIDVVERGPSGRALVIDYVTDAGTLRHAGRDGIRASLRYINANGTPTNLPSTLFFVEPVREQGRLTGGFRVYGGGFGHGVGMSQLGAVGMAKKGHSYEQILTHYYQGIALERQY